MPEDGPDGLHPVEQFFLDKGFEVRLGQLFPDVLLGWI